MESALGFFTLNLKTNWKATPFCHSGLGIIRLDLSKIKVQTVVLLVII